MSPTISAYVPSEWTHAVTVKLPVPGFRLGGSVTVSADVVPLNRAALLGFWFGPTFPSCTSVAVVAWHSGEWSSRSEVSGQWPTRLSVSGGMVNFLAAQNQVLFRRVSGDVAYKMR